jgi:hypothetical protein
MMEVQAAGTRSAYVILNAFPRQQCWKNAPQYYIVLILPVLFDIWSHFRYRFQFHMYMYLGYKLSILPKCSYSFSRLLRFEMWHDIFW